MIANSKVVEYCVFLLAFILSTFVGVVQFQVKYLNFSVFVLTEVSNTKTNAFTNFIKMLIAVVVVVDPKDIRTEVGLTSLKLGINSTLLHGLFEA